ncbi:MAG: hypothetical protein V8Q75_04970 [Bacilli bacterium]
MKKAFMPLAIIGIMLLTLTGCTKNKSYTFTVETGDKIKIQLNTTDGYDLSSDLPFTISKNGNTLSQGTFITISSYEEYVNAAKTDSLAKIIDERSKDNIEYVFYSYNNSEYNYVIKVKNSNTGILLGNPNSQEEAEKCFELLKFTLEK